MDKVIGTLRQLFDRLVWEQNAWSHEPADEERKPSASAQEVRDTLANSLCPIDEADFNDWFPAQSDELHVDFSDRRKFLYLPPLKKNAEFVPILHVACDLAEGVATMNLRVMLIRYVEDSGQDGGRRLCGVGFRFETPHGEQGEGRHDFYHAQLIRGFDREPSIECPDWLPCTQPSFPLVARCPVTLVVCLLRSLYGRKRFQQLLPPASGLSRWLKPYLEGTQLG